MESFTCLSEMSRDGDRSAGGPVQSSTYLKTEGIKYIIFNSIFIKQESQCSEKPCVKILRKSAPTSQLAMINNGKSEVSSTVQYSAVKCCAGVYIQGFLHGSFCLSFLLLFLLFLHPSDSLSYFTHLYF